MISKLMADLIALCGRWNATKYYVVDVITTSYISLADVIAIGG